MRPKLLEIEGLQSFREIQRIDFDRLGENGLFGIFGPTGSGKSTVLDAITFALFGKVKRADHGTQGIININANNAKVSFTFEILKDNSRKIYRVERNYQRKGKDKEDGIKNSCEPKVTRLIEVTEAGDIPVCDKTREITANIEKLLGLNHDDFTRAVVLPQNSFQEFLLLENSKKRDMLERIFYLEEYGKNLWEKVTRKMDSLRSRISVLSGELKGYADASDEALKKAQEEMEKTALDRKVAEDELKHQETIYNEAKEVWRHVQDLMLLIRKEEELLSNKDAVNNKKIALDKAIKADTLIEIINKTKESTYKLKIVEKDLGEVLNSIPNVIKEKNDAQQKLEAIKIESETEQPNLISRRTRLADALSTKAETEKIKERLNQYNDQEMALKSAITAKSAVYNKEKAGFDTAEKSLDILKKEIKDYLVDPDYRDKIQEGEKLENDVETRKRNVNELKQKIGALNAKVNDLLQKHNYAADVISSLKKDLNNMTSEKLEHESSMPDDWNSIQIFKERISSLQAEYSVLRVKNDELEEMNGKLSVQELSVKELKSKLSSLEERKKICEEHFQRYKLEYDNAVSDMQKNAAYMLSRELEDGKPCPVCGSEQHPSPAAIVEGNDKEELELRVKQSREQLVNSENALSKAKLDVLDYEGQVKFFTDQIEKLRQEQILKKTQYDVEKSKLPDELRHLELNQIQIELGKMNDLSLRKQMDIENWEKKQDDYKARIQEINDRLNENNNSENIILTELKGYRENLNQFNNTLMQQNNELDMKQQQYLDMLREYGVDSLAYELKRLAENDRKANQRQKQIEQTGELLERKRINIEKCKEEIKLLSDQNIKLTAEIISLRGQKDEREAKLKEIAGNSNIEDEIEKIDKRLEKFTELEKQYTEVYKIKENQLNDLEKRHHALESEQAIYLENLKKEQSSLQNSLIAKGFTGADEVESAVISKERQKFLADEINDYDQAGKDISAQKDMVQKKLDGRSITEEGWTKASKSYTDKASYKEECVSKSEIAKNNFNTIRIKHDKWTDLNRTHTELANKYGLFEQIQKLLKAVKGKDNSFIDFIAEERLRYVAAKASEILGVMTKFKYALELGTDNGFVIRDNANGGVHRMVTSLSGGETFLTSLSLALALSEQIQLKGQSPLEFFFLDEGFGTLDNNLLDTVIDSLERLSKKERVIGLISHVPELRNRIMRRLIVDPPTTQGDGSKVRIERA